MYMKLSAKWKPIIQVEMCKDLLLYLLIDKKDRGFDGIWWSISDLYT